MMSWAIYTDEQPRKSTKHYSCITQLDVSRTQQLNINWRILALARVRHPRQKHNMILPDYVLDPLLIVLTA